MKVTKLLVAGVAIMSAGFGLSGSVDAADSTAEVTVEAGSLDLTKVPHLQFGEIDVADIVDADPLVPVVKELETGDVTPATVQGDATDELKAIVSDFRGGAASWTLSAAMTPFTMVSPGTATLDATINLTPSILGNLVTIGAISTPVVTPAAGAGSGTNVIAFTPGSGNYLSIPQQDIQAGVYQSVLTWTLSDVVTTP